MSLLAELVALPHHRFWSDGVQMPELCRRLAPLLAGHRQVGDLHLLGIAIQHDGVLATLDARLPDMLAARSSWRESIEVLPVD